MGFLLGLILGILVFVAAFLLEKRDSKWVGREFNIWKPIIFGIGIAAATWLISLIAE